MTDMTENPMDPQARLHELMGAAAFGSLSVAEGQELERLLAADPAARRELGEIRATVAALPPAGSALALDAVPSADLEERIVRAVSRSSPGPVVAPTPAATRSRTWLLLAAAATLVVVSGMGGWVVGQRDSTAPTGPPGTLGATEAISFTGEPRGVEVDASVVAHTWGTETVMTIDGLEQGSYTVQVKGSDGRTVHSGTFIAPADGITGCRMMAGLLRADANAIVVSDADGDVVMRSRLPQTT